MPISDEVRRLEAKWRTGQGWPKRLEWFDIKGVRGWAGERFECRFPIMAVVGENGVGKSTVLQCAASIYRQPERAKGKDRFMSDFFPDTTWDTITDAGVTYQVREGGQTTSGSVRKPTGRWRGNPDRPRRHVVYIDLRRVQPVAARVGYLRIANSYPAEVSAKDFDRSRLGRFSQIMGRVYDAARLALTEGDTMNRHVPVLTQRGVPYSGFHQGAGETTVAELIQADLPDTSIVLVDEIESSLHPRAQRRLVRDIAVMCREQDIQVVLTTHSPYVLDELPLEARAQIVEVADGRRIIYGVTPDLAMSKMDDVMHHECDLYVEDARAGTMVQEILAAKAMDTVTRCMVVPYGAASVGLALGIMNAQRRFPRKSVVFLDGDQEDAPGCILLPGPDAPERVVFNALRSAGWHNAAALAGRPHADLADACTSAMTLQDEHDWVKVAATRLSLGGETLWRALCAAWATHCLRDDDAKPVAQGVRDALEGIVPDVPVPLTRLPDHPSPKPATTQKAPSYTGQESLAL